MGGSKSAKGGPNPLADMDRGGPNPLADLDRGVQIRGGSKSAVTPALPLSQVSGMQDGLQHLLPMWSMERQRA